MELADQVESLDAVPEPFRGFYSEAKGENGDEPHFVLDAEGLTGAVKNYRSILSEKKRVAARVEELEGKLQGYEGVDPEKARKAEAELRKLRNQLETQDAGVDEEKFEELLGKRTQRMREDHEANLSAKDKAIKERDERLSQLEAQLAAREIDGGVTLAAAKLDLTPGAVGDAILAARQIFRLEDGKLVALDENNKPMYGKDGEAPLSIDEWLASLRKDKSHWFKANANGGGATASDTGTGTKTISRKALDALPPDQRMAKMREGWTVTD